MTFDALTDPSTGSTMTTVRMKRQLTEQAIEAARRADWAAAAGINERILEYGPDSAAENRLAKALWEQGELAKAREHYQAALALDPSNRIAERNIDRLRLLLSEAGATTVPAAPASKAHVSIFIEETGKTGFAHLVELASPADLAQVNPGDFVELMPDGPRLVASSNGMRIGVVEPRVAARLLKLMADGNKYAAGVTSIGDKDVRIILRETFQDPTNYGKVSFPTAARQTDLRPYTKGTLVREEMELEEELELDEEVDSIEDIEAVLTVGATADVDDFEVGEEDDTAVAAEEDEDSEPDEEE